MAVSDVVIPLPLQPATRKTFSRTYVKLAIGLLTVVAILNSADRYVLTVLAHPMQKDLNLSDTQVGLILGIVFAIPYTVLGVPLSWLADRKSRPLVLSACVALWSAMTALSGMASSFISIVIPRIGTATGEAGCTPTAHSLISDYVTPKQRPVALSVFGSGASLGTMVGLMVGGILAQKIGWRYTFAAIGLPGLVVALGVALLLKETRTSSDARSAQSAAKVSFWASAVTLCKTPVFQMLMAVAAIGSMVAVGVMSFVTVLAIRKFHLDIRVVGTWFGLVSGVAGVSGMLFGGWVTARSGIKLRTWGAAICIAIGALLYFVSLQVGDPVLALGLLALGGFLQAGWYAPCFSGAQLVASESSRAQASAIVVLIAGIGQGLGPTIVGWLSDALRGSYGETNGLQYAMSAMALCGLLTALCMFIADRRLRASHLSVH